MILRLNHHAVLLEQFSGFLRDFDAELESGQRDHFDSVIRHMQITLKDTLIKMERVKHKKSSRLLWSLIGTDLKDADKELSDWSKHLLISFVFMSMPIKTSFVNQFPEIANEPRQPTWLLGLKANIRMEGSKSEASTVTMEDDYSIISEENSYADRAKQLWINRIDTTSASRRGVMTMDEVRIEVSRLFAVLKQADSLSTHILTAEHFSVTDDDSKRFLIASKLPDDTRSQQLLSEMLLESSRHVSSPFTSEAYTVTHKIPSQPLDHRIHIAQEFITAVAYVHAMGWVHKAIRPTNILMLHAHDDVPFPQGLGHAFLVGFEFARRGSARSTGTGHWGWKEDIYRHPDRQNRDGVDLEIYYTPMHDIYSVGVLLLELGTWKPLAQSYPDLKLADPDERRRLLLGYTDDAAATIGSRYAALAKKCIAVDVSGIDVQQVLTELQDLRV